MIELTERDRICDRYRVRGFAKNRQQLLRRFKLLRRGKPEKMIAFNICKYLHF